MSLSYMNLERRFQWALQGYSQTQFFYGQLEGSSTTRVRGPHRSRLAVATRTMRGGTAFGIYPFNRYRRVEFYGGLVNYHEQFDDPRSSRGRPSTSRSSTDGSCSTTAT